jgi:hypothetical protein
MKKVGIILAVLVVFALVSTVSAFGPITFPYNGKLVVTYVSLSAGYNDEFGIEQPGQLSLGFIHGNPPAVPGTIYENIGRCSSGDPVVLYLNNSPQGGSKTFYSDRLGGDRLDHALVIGPVNGVYTVGFEDIYGVRTIPGVPGDGDYNDVVLTVACTRDVTPIPEFPAIALPVGLIVGILGAVFYIRSTREP